MKDKLTLRSEIQKEFNNETVKNINIAIKISKVIRFLYLESTIFFTSMIPFLGMTIYYLFNTKSEVGASIGIVLMASHFILYKTLYKKVIFKSSKNTYDEFDYTIQVLNEIKEDKTK